MTYPAKEVGEHHGMAGVRLAYVVDQDPEMGQSGVVTFIRSVQEDWKTRFDCNLITRGLAVGVIGSGHAGTHASPVRPPILRLALGYVLEFWRDVRFAFRERRRLRGRIIVTNQFGCETLPIALRFVFPLSKIVAIAHTHPGMTDHARHPVRSFVEKLCYSAVSDIVFNSRAVKEEWARKLGRSGLRGRIIPYGLPNPSTALPVDYPAKQAGGVDFVCVARFVHWKGQRELVQAWKKVMKRVTRPVRLIFVGDGPTWDSTRRFSNELGLSGTVIFLGARDYGAAYFEGGDVGVLLSNEPEAFGLVLLEAMSRRKPIIASRLGGIPEVVESNVTGILVDPFDAEAVASAMLRAVESEELRHRLGEAGEARWRKYFTVERMLDEYVAVFRGLNAHKKNVQADIPDSAAITDGDTGKCPETTLWGPSRNQGEACVDEENSSNPSSGFCCPVCGHEDLRNKGPSCVCNSCGREYKVKYCLPDFSHNPAFYWGEVDRDVMKKIVEADPANTVESQLQELLKTKPADFAGYLSQYTMDRRRAGWKFLTGLNRKGRALDFGCGWGALSLSLAESFSETVLTDVVPERVAVAVRRAREKGLSGVSGCTASGWPRLPFKDGFFDLVVLNGVFEWIPDSIEGNPEEIQRFFLREVRRILKPSGQLYVGIENRFGAGYFMGRREEHTKLRFVSLFPRAFARLYHRVATGRSYRNYTYGRMGWKSLAAKVGFKEIAFYCPYPDYREFNRIVDVDDPASVAKGFSPTSVRGKIAHALFMRTGLFKYLANSFMIILGGNGERASFVDRLIKKLKEEKHIYGPCRVYNYSVTSTARVLIKIGDRERHWLLSLALDSAARTRLTNATEMRRKISQHVEDSGLRLSLLDFIAGDIEGEPYICEPYCEGERMTAFYGSKGWHEMEARCLQWLAKLQNTVSFIDSFSCELSCAGTWALMLDSLTEKGRALFRDTVSNFEKGKARVSPIHGDFRPDNVIAAPDGLIKQVIDWDLALETGLPLWDVLTFLSDPVFDSGEKWAVSYGFAAHKVLDSFEQRNPIAEYVSHLQLRPVDACYAILTFPVWQLHNKMRFGDGKSDVILAGLEPVLLDLSNRANKMVIPSSAVP